MAEPTERMMEMGRLAYMRYVEVVREERIRVHGKALKAPYDDFGDLPESNQFGWAEAALVAFNMGVNATKLTEGQT